MSPKGRWAGQGPGDLCLRYTNLILDIPNTMQKNNDVYWALEKKKIFMIKCAYKMEAYVGPILLLGVSLSLCGKVYGTIS